MAAVTDASVVSGVGIGVRAAYRGGATAAALVGVALGRWMSEELSARYFWGGPGSITLQKLGKTAGANIFGRGVSGATMAASNDAPTLSGFLQGFVPGVNTKNALMQMWDTCR